MCFIDSMIQLRNERNMSQKLLGNMCGVTQAAISKYERKIDTIPTDIAYKVTEILKSPRLRKELIFEKRAEYYNVPTPNNVDDYIVTVLDVLIEEFKEAANAAEELKGLIRNKKSDKQIDEARWKEIIKCEIQLVDPLPALKLHHANMIETFDRFSLKELEKEQYKKLVEKDLYKEKRPFQTAI